MKHKHADVIKAWADGAQIEWRFPNSELLVDREWGFAGEHPVWKSKDAEFRIKPSNVDAQPADEQTDNHSGICLEVEA